jgi:DNA-binding MarR family transcriptional regulator
MPDSESQRTRLIGNLQAVLELVPAELDRRLVESGLSWFEFAALAALDAAPSSRLRLSALADATNAALPRTSRVAKGLELRGLLAKVACEEDGRATNAVLTKSGARVLEQAKPMIEQFFRELLSGIDPQELEGLAKSSGAMASNIRSSP